MASSVLHPLKRRQGWPSRAETTIRKVGLNENREVEPGADGPVIDEITQERHMEGNKRGQHPGKGTLRGTFVY